MTITNRFSQARLKLEWRRYLTSQLLTAYFSHRAFFKLKLQACGIDNPDQVGFPFYILFAFRVLFCSASAATARHNAASSPFCFCCKQQQRVNGEVLIMLAWKGKAGVFSGPPPFSSSLIPHFSARNATAPLDICYLRQKLVVCLQRICDDVPAFTDASVFLVLGVTRKFFNCVAFAGVCLSVRHDTRQAPADGI